MSSIPPSYVPFGTGQMPPPPLPPAQQIVTEVSSLNDLFYSVGDDYTAQNRYRQVLEARPNQLVEVGEEEEAEEEQDFEFDEDAGEAAEEQAEEQDVPRRQYNVFAGEAPRPRARRGEGGGVPAGAVGPVCLRRFVPVPGVQYEDITLKDYQVEHVNIMQQLLARSLGVLDTSVPGAGKTYTTLYMAKRYGLPLLVIAPPTIIESVWLPLCQRYGIACYGFMSYDRVRGTMSKKYLSPNTALTSVLTHGLLTRTDALTESGTSVTSFMATDTWRRIVQSGVLLVLDEIQRIKNPAKQTRGVTALVKTILDVGGASRYICLSGSPYERPERALRLLYLLGIIRTMKLYDKNRSGNITIEGYGIGDLITYCAQRDRAQTSTALGFYPTTSKENIEKLAHLLFITVVKPLTTHAMPSPPIEGTKYVYNGYFMLDPRSTETARAYIGELLGIYAKMKRDRQIRDEFVHSKQDVAQRKSYIPFLRGIEQLMVEPLTQYVHRTLAGEGNYKIIILVNFINDTLNMFVDALAMYNPVVITGEIPMSRRPDLIDRFNTNPNHRLLIATTPVMAEGVNLQDLTGEEPRIMLLSPSFSIMMLHQASQRIYRSGLVGDATVIMFFPDVRNRNNGMVTMANILKNLYNDSITMGQILDQQVRDGVVFPGMYETYYFDGQQPAIIFEEDDTSDTRARALQDIEGAMQHELQHVTDAWDQPQPQ